MSDNQEILAKLNNKIYVAPCGVLYVEHFKDFVNGNIIDIDAMSYLKPQERFKVKEQLFGYICNTLTALKGYGEFEYSKELEEICGKIYSVSHLVNYLAEQGQFDEAIYRMDKFMTNMLDLSDKMYSKKR